MATAQDLAIIREGNVTAHGGDASVDAQLYGQGGRWDVQAFEQLYGLDPNWVLRIGEFFTVHHSYCRVILGCSSSNWFRTPGNHCSIKQPLPNGNPRVLSEV